MMQNTGYDVDAMTSNQICNLMDAYGMLRYGQKIVTRGTLMKGHTSIKIPMIQ